VQELLWRTSDRFSCSYLFLFYNCPSRQLPFSIQAENSSKPVEGREELEVNQYVWQWISVIAMVIVGVIHLFMVPLEYDETPLMGILFAVNFFAALIASVGIIRQEMWGWLLGMGIAAGSVLGYVVSRTVGLPGMEIEAWLQPLGVLSLVVETFFIGLVTMQKPWAATS
jgi:hypothetical protein